MENYIAFLFTERYWWGANRYVTVPLFIAF